MREHLQIWGIAQIMRYVLGIRPQRVHVPWARMPPGEGERERVASSQCSFSPGSSCGSPAPTGCAALCTASRSWGPLQVKAIVSLTGSVSPSFLGVVSGDLCLRHSRMGLICLQPQLKCSILSVTLSGVWEGDRTGGSV